MFEHDGKLLVKRIAACGGDIVIINEKAVLSRRTASLFLEIMLIILWTPATGLTRLFRLRMLLPASLHSLCPSAVLK